MLLFSAFTISTLKIIAVVVILLCMIILLLGIGHLFSGNFHTDDVEVRDLRHDIKHKDNVIGEGNVFRPLVGKAEKK